MGYSLRLKVTISVRFKLLCLFLLEGYIRLFISVSPKYESNVSFIHAGVFQLVSMETKHGVLQICELSGY